MKDSDHPVTISVLDHAESACLLLDAERCCQYANHAAAALLQKPRASLPGLSLEAAFAAVASAESAVQLRLTLATGESGRSEISLRSSGPSCETQRFELETTHSAAGCLLSLRRPLPCQPDPITDESCRRILEETKWGIAVGGADEKTLLYVNPAFAAMHGFAPDELIGTPIAQVFAADVRATLPALFDTIRRDGHCRIESTHVRKDGQTFPVLIDVTAVQNAWGEVAYRIVNVQDISEQVAAREELRVRKEFFQRTFTDAPVGMAIADLNGRYLCANGAMCRMIGYTEEELKRMTYRDITHPDDVARNDALREGMLNEQAESFEMEKRYIRKHGRIVWALMVVSIIKGPDGKALVTVGQMLDIDRLKQTEASLRKNEAKLKEAQQLARLGSWVLDIPNDALSWSDEVFRLFEIDPTVFIPSYAAFLDAIHPDDRAAVEEAYRSSLVKQTPYEITHRLQMADGRIKWVTERCNTEFDVTGKPLQSVGTIQDVTARVETEQTVTAANLTYRAVLSTSLDGFWIADRDGRFLDINDRYCTQSGYPREELLGMRLVDVEADEQAEQTSAKMRRLFDRKGDRFETRHRRKDGSIWHVEISATCNLDGDRLYMFARDITERKRAEEALHATNDLLSKIINTAPVRVFWKDSNLRFLGCNLAFAEDAGMTDPAALIGKDDFQMSWAKQAEMYRRDDRMVMESGKPKLSFEEPQSRADGRMAWLSTSKVPLKNRNDEIIGVLGIYQDITQAKQHEQEIIRSREQVRALAAYHERILEEERKHISREIHDELGQQLSALKLDIGLLRLSHGDQPDITDMAQRMRQTVDSSINVVRQIAGNLRPAAIDLGIVAAVEWLAQEFTSRWNIDCEVDAADGDISLGQTQSTVVFRIVQESLTNAARHSRARRVSITMSCFGNLFHLGIRDDGQGFNVERASASGRYGLLGMRERVHTLGGTIEIESLPDKGTIIRITFPLET